MRLANLTHGAFFMLGAYIGAQTCCAMSTARRSGAAALGAGIAVAILGGLIERLVLQAPGGQFARTGAGDARHILHHRRCLPDDLGWRSHPRRRRQRSLQSPIFVAGFAFPAYRLAVVICAVIAAAFDSTFCSTARALGAMIRAGVDDMQMARAVGIPVSRLFTAVFCLGAGIAGRRRRSGGADPVRLSGARRRHASAGAYRRHPRWRRQSSRRVHRQLSSSASSTRSAPRCFRISPMSSCSCR